ncbi:hypothetical protein [Streptomyces mirabilis]|uniref:hypothetical protein n=1 Tax=Streptomyces mirabilis TaxID=68239 RepID=UPI0036921713
MNAAVRVTAAGATSFASSSQSRQYLARVPNSSARIGERLVLTEDMYRQALADARALCKTLVDVLR